MGVIAAHEFIKKNKVPYSQHTLENFLGLMKEKTVYFDLFGSLFYRIKQMLHQGKKEGLLYYLVKLFKEGNFLDLNFDRILQNW